MKRGDVESAPFRFPDKLGEKARLEGGVWSDAETRRHSAPAEASAPGGRPALVLNAFRHH